jgi:hypothetical protein
MAHFQIDSFLKEVHEIDRPSLNNFGSFVHEHTASRQGETAGRKAASRRRRQAENGRRRVAVGRLAAFRLLLTVFYFPPSVYGLLLTL